MKLARHSTIDLTMKLDTNFSLQDKYKAIQKLPQVKSGEDENDTDDNNTIIVNKSVDIDISNTNQEGRYRLEGS